jgi:hypothetical protein
MKTPPDSNEPLLQSLADEVSDLPLLAAQEARKTRALRMKQRRQVSLAITVLLFGMCLWQVFPGKNVAPDSIAMPSPAVSTQQTTTMSLQPSMRVIVRTEEQARNEPLPLPDGLTKDQENVVIAAQGLPLLLIRNSSGIVTRIHVVER